ncbi:MAG: hypothetical protein QOD62_2960, partial [Actinomycetota bacterium]|nr:hypothetical protein [Actinomycetota bacterium]
MTAVATKTPVTATSVEVGAAAS